MSQSEDLNTGSIRFIKWGEMQKGEEVVGTLEGITFDAPSQFGPESSVRLMTDEGDVVQCRLSAGLIKTFRENEKRMVPGTTRLTFTYKGKVRTKKGNTMHDVGVKAEGLLPKGGAKQAPVAAPVVAAIVGAAAALGDDSFDPKSLS